MPNESKYYPLQEFFKLNFTQGKKELKLQISEVEHIIGGILPTWAFSRKDNFWSNSGYSDHIQKRAWLSQGYQVVDHSIENNSKSGEIKFVYFEIQ